MRRAYLRRAFIIQWFSYAYREIGHVKEDARDSWLKFLSCYTKTQSSGVQGAGCISSLLSRFIHVPHRSLANIAYYSETHKVHGAWCMVHFLQRDEKLKQVIRNWDNFQRNASEIERNHPRIRSEILTNRMIWSEIRQTNPMENDVKYQPFPTIDEKSMENARENGNQDNWSLSCRAHRKV